MKQSRATKFEESKILNFSNLKGEVTSPSEVEEHSSHQTQERKQSDTMRYFPQKQQKDTLDFEETKMGETRKGKSKKQDLSSGDEVPIPLYLAILLKDSKPAFSKLLENGVSSLLQIFGPESGDLRNTCESL